MTKELQTILQQASQLSRDEQLSLIAHLTKQLKTQAISHDPSSWLEREDMAAYPFMGEDAQDWLSRPRQDNDTHRESCRLELKQLSLQTLLSQSPLNNLDCEQFPKEPGTLLS